MLRPLFAILFAALAVPVAGASGAPRQTRSPLTSPSMNAALPAGGDDNDPSLIAKAEILLDRAHFSPGEIDGSDGDNFRGALRAFQQVRGLVVSGKLDADTWNALASGPSPVLKSYAVTDADVAGPFTRAIPTHLEQMARLPGLSYTSAVAELAEKFHMSQDLLRKLNPHADFSRTGTEIAVADVPDMKLTPGRRSVEAVPPNEGGGPTAATIVIDKPRRNLRAYDQDGKFLAFYPVTVGSEEKPALSGVFNVRAVDWNPEYHYDPKFALEGSEDPAEADRRAGAEQPRGPGLDRPHGALLRHSRHALTRRDRENRIARLHPPHELGRGRPRGHDASENRRAIRGPGLARRRSAPDRRRRKIAVRAAGALSRKAAAQDLPWRNPAKRLFLALVVTAPSFPALGGFAASLAAPFAKAPSKQPLPKPDDEKALVYEGGMAASDLSACLADLRSAKIAFEPVGDAKDGGCELTGVVRLVSVTTPFGDVAIGGKPTMVCSFARQFGVWARDVAAPLTLAYAGERLKEIEAGSAFSCRAGYDKPGAVPSGPELTKRAFL